MKLIIGLGNPGEKFQNNRSNIGFKILDVLANNNNIEIRTKKKKSLIGRGEFDGEDIVLLKPQTFTDLAGEAALYIASFLKIKPPDIVVIMDDFGLPLGKLVVEKGGNDYSHPAIKNLAIALKSPEFIRLRVGILGKTAGKLTRDKYVSSEFEPMEILQLISIINDAEAAVRSISSGDINEVIEKFKQ
ncbi:MAG TPA: aminoacyl-tRNA hydrolase [Leptospiraceae bacterium]|jgi:PTH1 family peptidyl-tRNA hydrolase|nr:aminoacyl-tRNA hydrolase [Leptospirales bacterium]HMX55608.1 aminoacyl-tRNA hydrolase [Leptospiraceae bacterium]HMY45050.1 aminoacyl-tRNA hydrolase [Leptospiraceae bacterium]HMZ37922.1 aminoacyl-tRNA hydrolase [Leptospiraceae bacterium]HNJ33034.1 aminoacyl-tRNA hydrolase [Leptospiraceae bacterium]